MASISTCVTTNGTCSTCPNLINIDLTHIKLQYQKFLESYDVQTISSLYILKKFLCHFVCHADNSPGATNIDTSTA